MHKKQSSRSTLGVLAEERSGLASSMLLEQERNQQSGTSLAYLSAHLSNPRIPTLTEMRRMESQLDKKLREASPSQEMLPTISATKIVPNAMQSNNASSSSKPISTLQQKSPRNTTLIALKEAKNRGTDLDCVNSS